MTNVPPLDWTEVGLEIPQEEDIYDGFMADIDEGFGGGLNPAKTTPQGQLATTMAAVTGSKNNDFAFLTNQMNPNTATGIWLDALCKINFIERLSGAGTVVECVVSGAVNAVIPAGTLVQDTKGYKYKSLGDITIGANNTGSGQFQNTEIGPIGVAPNTVTKILVARQGWEKITNPNAGELGRLVESDSDLRNRRSHSVSVIGNASVNSIRAAVLMVAGVIDCYAYSNDTDQNITIGSTDFPIKAKSIYVAVQGGDNQAIAETIFSKKTQGVPYNGNTNVTITYPDYPPPAPTTVVTFQRPTQTNVYFAVTIRDQDDLPDNIKLLIQTAIINHFTGNGSATRVSIGQIIFASEYYNVITGINGFKINIVSIYVGLSANPDTTTVELGVDQAPIISEENISVLFAVN